MFADYIMSLYPNGTYQRVTHFTDPAVHVPLTAMGFKHAGDEVWYLNDGADLSFKLCSNKIGADESNDCANSHYAIFDKNSHVIYVGHLLPGMCKNNASEMFL